MEKHSLKSKIYRLLDELNEEQLFEANELLSAYLKTSDQDDNWDRLSEEDKAAIEEGIQQQENQAMRYQPQSTLYYSIAEKQINLLSFRSNYKNPGMLIL